MSRTAVEIIAPILEGIEGTPDLAEGSRVSRAISQYLHSMTEETSLEDALSVTAYGIAMGLNRSSLAVAAVYHEQTPFYQQRLLLVESFGRALRSPEMQDWRELWNFSDLAKYRGVGRAAVKNMADRNVCPLPVVVTPEGERLYDPVEMRAWSDSIPTRQR